MHLLVDLLELLGNLSGTCEELQVLQLCQVSHRSHLADWANQNVAIDDRVVIDHGEDVATPQKYALSHSFTSEVKRGLIVGSCPTDGLPVTTDERTLSAGVPLDCEVVGLLCCVYRLYHFNFLFIFII